MYAYIYIVLCWKFAVMDISESISERYTALGDLQSLSAENEGNTSTENAIFYDVTTLSECAMKALVASGLTFLYSKEDKTCVLTESGSSGPFSSGYNLYLRDDKDKYQRSCFYKMLRKQEQYYREAKRKCQQLGGYVLEINSKEENYFVKELFKGVSVWLGAVQIRENNNTFRWERGGEMIFTDWASDYPIIATSLYNYCAILTWGGWKNMYCSFNPFYVVCEFDRCDY